ncbi:MAG TPA: hypothetical protein VFS30_14750, partial [Dehalococcoidia bacterium]|nr:hypothetical protein [Dehalococcoidia bacterium]
MKHLQSNTDLARIFIYNAGDERIAVFDCVNCPHSGRIIRAAQRTVHGRQAITRTRKGRAAEPRAPTPEGSPCRLSKRRRPAV